MLQRRKTKRGDVCHQPIVEWIKAGSRGRARVRRDRGYPQAQTAPKTKIFVPDHAEKQPCAILCHSKLLRTPHKSDGDAGTDCGLMSSPVVSKLISRNEFRAVLKGVVRCLRSELDAPGLAPLTSEELLFWFRNITLEDIEKVNAELAGEAPGQAEAAVVNASRVQSILHKLREKIRNGDPEPEADKSVEASSEKAAE